MNEEATDMTKEVGETLRYIREKTSASPRIAVILGSGLGDFAEHLDDAVKIDTGEIPNYPRSTVPGHKGRMYFGNLGETPLLVFQGRVHFYESGTIETVLYPIRVAAAVGVSTLFLTNAAGGVNLSYRPGDLMLITDQINLTFANLNTRGTSDASLYDPVLLALIRKAARRDRIRIRQGVYCGVSGPSYETAAEIRMVRKIGGDAVGMSTVNEVSLARQLGMNVAGISCITNLSTGILAGKLSHEEVTIVADRVRDRFTKLISGIVKSLYGDTLRKGSRRG